MELAVKHVLNGWQLARNINESITLNRIKICPTPSIVEVRFILIQRMAQPGHGRQNNRVKQDSMHLALLVIVSHFKSIGKSRLPFIEPVGISFCD